MKERKRQPRIEEDAIRIQAFVRTLTESGFRFTSLTEQELRAMSVDELYIQYTQHEYVGSEFETSGGVIREQMAHQTLVWGIYLEKIEERLRWYCKKSRRSWTLKELSALPIANSYRLYCEYEPLTFMD